MYIKLVQHYFIISLHTYIVFFFNFTLCIFDIASQYQGHVSSRHTTVKPVLRAHSKIDKTKVLKINGSLMKVESIAECSLGAFCNTFDLH